VISPLFEIVGGIDEAGAERDIPKKAAAYFAKEAVSNSSNFVSIG
jgi:hypothetical protein